MRFRSKIRTSELILILDQLSIYISSGLHIDAVLEILIGERSDFLREQLEDIQRQVRMGRMFSACLSRSVRDRSIIGIIEQGELTGRLGDSLRSAHTILEKREELKKKCISALMYPSLIGLFALVITVGLMRGVLPQIIPLLRSLHITLPIITKIVMHISDGMVAYGVYALVLCTIGMGVYAYVYWKYALVRRGVQVCLINMPILNTLILSYYHSLFLRSCGLLIGSGLSAHVAYGRAASAIGCIPVRLTLGKENSSLIRGTTLSEIFRKKEHRMNTFVAALVSAGESTGSLAKSCLRASEVLDRNLDQSLKRLTSLIEPMLMILLGATIGTVALSIMLPIYDISKVLQR